MRNVNLFLISLVTMASLSFGLTSCDGGRGLSSTNKKGKSDFDRLEIIDKGFDNSSGLSSKVFLIKNKSDKEVDRYNLRCKFYNLDGTSYTQEITVTLAPGGANIFHFLGAKNVSSWKFIK